MSKVRIARKLRVKSTSPIEKPQEFCFFFQVQPYQ